jgi:hypothetical protein
MSLPAPQEPTRDGGKWATIRYALDSNARTFRLCVIWAVAIVSPVAATVITLLVRHMLLCHAMWHDVSRRPVAVIGNQAAGARTASPHHARDGTGA